MARTQNRKEAKAHRIKMEKIEKQIMEDSSTNKMLDRHVELPAFFKEWITGSRLIAVIPALNLNDAKSRSYFSVGSLKNPEGGPEIIRVSPVYMFINEGFTDFSEPQEMFSGRNFIFDTEFNKLFSYQKNNYTQKYHYVKEPTFDQMKAHLESNPVVLFFHGCDDGHVGRRFKTEKDAIEYIQCMNVFEDIFEDSEIQSHN